MNIWTNSGDCISSQTAHKGSVSFLSEINFNVPVFQQPLTLQQRTGTAGGVVGQQLQQQGFSSSSTAVAANGSMAALGPTAVLTPMMISLGADNVMKVWDLSKFRPVAEVIAPAHQGTLSKAVWSGNHIITGSASGAVRLYERSASGGGGGGGAPGISGGTGTTGLGSAATDAEWWVGRDISSHSMACVDLLSTDTFVASASKSGQILKWEI
jgi:WD40 repeat protein